MYEELKKDNIIIELETLLHNVENIDETITSYAEFMKERILGVSCNN